MVRWLILALLLAFSVLRYIRGESAEKILRPETKIRLTARVIGEPVKKYGKTWVRTAKLAVELPGDVDILPTAEIQVVGTVEERVTAKGTPILVLRSETFSILPPPFIWRLAIALNHRLSDNLLRWLPAREAGLAVGILLGGSREINQTLRNDFARIGLLHIVAASGFNVTLVASWTRLVCQRLFSRRLAISFAIVSSILYVFVAGASAAVIRAAIMAGAALLGEMWGRESDAKWWLVVAATLMLVVNPDYVADIGWQLSFAATAGMVWLTATGGRWAELKTTLAAQAATLPLVWHHFGQVSLIAPLANFLLLWTVPLIMQVTLVASLMGIVVPVWGKGIAYLSWPLLHLLVIASQTLSGWSISSWEAGPLSWGGVAGYYVVGGAIYWFIRWRQYAVGG